MPTLRSFFAERFILVLISIALLAVTLITTVGMTASVVVAETVQGSGSAINIAGSLRRLTHRIASLIVVEALVETPNLDRITTAIANFEEQLHHPNLQSSLEKQPQSEADEIYRNVHRNWESSLRPHMMGFLLPYRASTAEYNALLEEVDHFVDQLNQLVNTLERGAENQIHALRMTLAAAMLLIAVVMIIALVLLHRRLARPLDDLLTQTGRFARGEFSARVRHTGTDELGRVGAAFNQMAEELTKLYRNLEDRVQAKTELLLRSNESLNLLYHAIARLYHAPTDPTTYSDTAQHMDAVLGLPSTFACLLPKHDGPATVLATTRDDCPARAAGRCGGGSCVLHPESQPRRSVVVKEEPATILLVPLRDVEGHYGMLRLTLAPSAELGDWQRQLIEALSRHIGMALGMARRTEQARLLALQEERSIIARELHDSLAQSLSYLKIQVSLLQRVIAEPERAEESASILADLRLGLNAAYRQLRELLASFRLSMSGDLRTLLTNSVEEYARRGSLPIHLEVRLAGCHLTPNEEIHVLHIVREALSNAIRHAKAQQIWVKLVATTAANGENLLNVIVDDDGIGLPLQANDAPSPYHHGLNIMRERARSLHGEIRIGPRPDGGTRISLSFAVASAPVAT